MTDCFSPALLEQIENFEEDLKQDLEEIRDKVEESKSIVSKINLEDPGSIFKGLGEKLVKHPVCFLLPSTPKTGNFFLSLCD